MQDHRRLGDARQAADARADHDAGALSALVVLGPPPGILDRLNGRAHREEDEGIHLALVLGRDPVIDVEATFRGLAARHLSGDLRRQIRHVEGLDRADSGFAVQQAAPDPLRADAQGSDQTDTGDDDPSHVHCIIVKAREAGRPVSRRPFQLCASMKVTASLTVMIFSAASSGISQPNSSSKAMTSSTVSRLSAPRSSIKLAFSVTLASSTPRCSTTIFLTRSAMSLMFLFLRCNGNDLKRVDRSAHVWASRAVSAWPI